MLKKEWKRRLLSQFLCICCLFTSLQVFAIPASQTGGVGDVNNNNEVDIIDALLVAQFSAGLNPQPFDQVKAEVSKDGKVNIMDALLIAQASAGLITIGTLPGLSIYIAGDSTVQTYVNSTIHQAGWGQMLPEYFSTKATIVNKAIGGRTARRFIDEGYLDQIFSVIKAGDYLLVQFGTNDGNKTATYTFNGQTIPYYLDPQTDFKTYLMQYINGARSRGATCVLVTPPPRNSAYCTGGNGTGAWAQAMVELGAAQNVPVVDLNTMTVNYLKAICPSPTPENFFLIKADGTVDGTHFQENGARILAGFIANGLNGVAGIRTLILPLAAYLTK